jgi:hypothetical protein
LSRRTDQIFQLSLTEIAFTLCFIMLLLLGYLLFAADHELEEAKAQLASMVETGARKDVLDAAQRDLKAALSASGASNPDEALSKLVEAEQAKAENRRLKQEIAELDAKLTALTEIKERLQEVASKDDPDATADDVASALALQKRVRTALEEQHTRGSKAAASAAAAGKAVAASRTPAASDPMPAERHSSSTQVASTSGTSQGKRKPEGGSRDPARDLSEVMQALSATNALKMQLRAQMNKDLEKSKESQTIQALVASAKSYDDLGASGVNIAKATRENADLRGQVAFLKGRLDARGGRDYPPCWADESGKVEFLFSVEVRPEGVVVAPAWPARREAAAKALPGIDDVLASPYSNQEFVRRIQGIFEWSKHQDPECRHYVELKSSIPDAVQSDRARLMVENYFYKTEVRR